MQRVQGKRKAGPHAVVGIVAVLAGHRYPASAVVTQPVRTLWIDRHDFCDVTAEGFDVRRGFPKALVALVAGEE